MANQDISVHANQVRRPASLNGLRVREDIAYTNYRGEEHGRTLKRVNKILDKLGPVLQRILAADETVLYAARMQAPVSLGGATHHGVVLVSRQRGNHDFHQPPHHSTAGR